MIRRLKRQFRICRNPHQEARYYGDFDKIFDQLHGKEISYNNLLDIDAAVALIDEFEAPTVAILKHNNACGLATRETIAEAWTDALAGEPCRLSAELSLPTAKSKLTPLPKSAKSSSR